MSYFFIYKTLDQKVIYFLVDLGIDLENIKSKTLAVLFFKKCDEKFVKEADMSGPLLLALIYGSLLMIVQKKTIIKITNNCF